MTTASNAVFRFTGFNVKESRILNHSIGDRLEILINIRPSGIIFSQLNQFELNLEVVVKSNDEKFEAVIKSSSFFDFDSTDNQPLTPENPFLTQNAMAITFPYIRAYISALTALSGSGVVNLPAINLLPLAEVLKENTTTM
jgi:preprotein translocase subunit SecB